MDTLNPLAVVTGASSGIGYELAKQFAAHGFDLIIAAEDDALDVAAAALTAQGGRAQAVRTDLTTREGVEKLLRAVTATRRPVAAAALNAGVGRGGPFLETDLADELEIIDLNVTSTVHLAKGLLPGMVEDGEGRVLITSSIASTMPGSFQAVYNASKSFLQSFAQALQNELKDTGVTVTSLMPGPTETEFFERAGMLDTKVGRSEKDDPAQVAAQGFEAMMAGRDKVVAGSWKTRAQGLAGRVLPDSVKAHVHRGMAAPASGTDG
ncbi:oxidoreductase [Streptomyces sp. CB00455]|uniref:SDR family NAD(P)-dependent oxidoreductase n=1 Tax=Streptomyces sp. CB00455 TaxID=1703927 RepID=UPI00093A688A|nr:SDR family NAD(P)-dependent oxidoreductase [Streptomyces sp. CB00455]OKK22278.1 oxidoreductase [Streptomyces sp. CB00455]